MTVLHERSTSFHTLEVTYFETIRSTYQILKNWEYINQNKIFEKELINTKELTGRRVFLLLTPNLPQQSRNQCSRLWPQRLRQIVNVPHLGWAVAHLRRNSHEATQGQAVLRATKALHDTWHPSRPG